MIVETERLRLRELMPADAPALLECFADPYARRFYPDFADREAADRWIGANLERYARDGFGLWALVLKETGALVGDCGLTLQEVEGRQELEVGWHVRADLRGRGLAREAGRACLAWGMSETEAGDWPRVISLVHRDNAASEAVASRVHDRRLPDPIDRRGGPHWIYVTDRISGKASAGS